MKRRFISATKLAEYLKEELRDCHAVIDRQDTFEDTRRYISGRRDAYVRIKRHFKIR